MPTGYVEQLFNDGQASLQRGDLEKAESDFRKVLAANPAVAGAWANLGVIAMRRKEWSSALEFLRKAEKLAPSVAG
ncbi:MAG: tetratricopeptide repeat protein, partial [Candidatus Acidiferrales bacterium]